MTRTFTKNDVLRYFYEEVTKAEKNEIEEFLSTNRLLQDYYCELLSMDKHINQVQPQPKVSTVNHILAYSKSLCLQN